MVATKTWEIRTDTTTWREASCLPDRCFCEAVQSGTVRQPANAISSSAFVVMALLVLMRSRTPTAWRFAGAALVVGVGSAFFHASLTFWGQTADVLGMYLVPAAQMAAPRQNRSGRF